MFTNWHCLVVITWFFLPCASSAQYYFYNDDYYNSRVLIDIGISLSAFNCLTDLGGRSGSGGSFLKDLNLNQTHAGVGLYATLLIDQVIGIRSELSLGTVSASDAVLKHHSPAINRYQRNLHFKSRIFELAVILEAYPVRFVSRQSHPLLSPYLLLGLGFFRFNPRADLNGTWVALHPLRTEGQGFKTSNPPPAYNLTQLIFPVGVGIRYEVSAVVNCGFEVVYRILRTDYLDDVSTRYIDPQHFANYLKGPAVQNAIAPADRSGEILPGTYQSPGAIRGNPANKDGYFSLNFKVGFTINRKHR